MGRIDDKIYSDQKHEEPQYTREWLEEKVNEFLKNGGSIRTIPQGVFSEDAQPASVIRRRIEKHNNFGDDKRKPPK